MTALKTNATAFNADLKEFAKKIDLDLGLVRRKVAIDLSPSVKAQRRPLAMD